MKHSFVSHKRNDATESLLVDKNTHSSLGPKNLEPNGRQSSSLGAHQVRRLDNMHDRPGSTSLECSGPLAILFLHESTPHPPATLARSLDKRTTGAKGFKYLSFRAPPVCGADTTSQGAQLAGNIARVHECVNQQHCRDTPPRHLAILQYTTNLYAGCHANTRAYRSSGSLLLGAPPVCGRIFSYSAFSENTPSRSGSRPRTMHPFTEKYRSPQSHLWRTPPVCWRVFYYCPSALHE